MTKNKKLVEQRDEWARLSPYFKKELIEDDKQEIIKLLEGEK